MVLVSCFCLVCRTGMNSRESARQPMMLASSGRLRLKRNLALCRVELVSCNLGFVSCRVVSCNIFCEPCHAVSCRVINVSILCRVVSLCAVLCLVASGVVSLFGVGNSICLYVCVSVFVFDVFFGLFWRVCFRQLLVRCR